MNATYACVQKPNVDFGIETTNRLQQTANRDPYQESNSRASLISHDSDNETTSDKDLTAFDGGKEGFFISNESDDLVSDISTCIKMLKAVKEGELLSKEIKGEKLHREALEAMTTECEKIIEDAVWEALKEAKKEKAKAVHDALKEYAEENEVYIQQLKQQHQQNMEEEIARTRKKIEEETERRVEEEKRSSEYHIKLAIEEAQDDFRGHLKKAVHEAQEAEARMEEDKFRQMKREFEEKYCELTRDAAEEKEKALLWQQCQMQKGHEKVIEEMKKEEAEGLTRKLKSLEKEHINIMSKLESKLAKMEQEMQNLAEKLRESTLQKNETDLELKRLRTQLDQFLKLAASADTEAMHRIKSRSKTGNV